MLNDLLINISLIVLARIESLYSSFKEFVGQYIARVKEVIKITIN